jgi:hypothetical protein
MPTMLHVGCGPKRKDRTTRGFNQPQTQEIRMEMDPAAKPDAVGKMTDIQAVGNGSGARPLEEFAYSYRSALDFIPI